MKLPLPIFDDIKHIELMRPEDLVDQTTASSALGIEDYTHTLSFLKSYNGSVGTFNSYRREVERLLHWCNMIAKKSLKDLKRQDIEDFIKFCLNPPKSWIGLSKVPRFITKDGAREPNKEWRPFIVALPKASLKKGERPAVKDFEFGQSSLKDTFAILGSFYNYLLQEEYVQNNPVALIRQKSKFIQKFQVSPKIRRLSELQWYYLYEETKKMAEEDPNVHERTLFMLCCLYSMYLRISELAGSNRWTPLMNHFYRDSENNWWYETIGKGNKKRQIAVSNSMLDALTRWRKILGLSSLPSPSDSSPLIPKIKGVGAITNTSYIREILQLVFDRASSAMKVDDFTLEAETLEEATVHWLRHTGISEDVKHRPREHVRDDAGHGSGAITDRYINVELRARHRSAKDKVIEG